MVTDIEYSQGNCPYIDIAGDHTFVLKYYSSEREVDFCGHATISIMYDLMKNGKELINKIGGGAMVRIDGEYILH